MLQQILEELAPYQATLVAVSKTKPESAIQTLYDAGQRHFGENRVQELAPKHDHLPKDIHWHLIGHLQSNKVKYIAPFVYMIHSVDSYKLLREINKQAAAQGRSIQCLLQFKIAAEDTKYGFDWTNVVAMLEDETFKQLDHITICGVMGMATFTDDEQQVRAEFQQLRQYFTQLKTQYFSDQPTFKEISMGMSGDYNWALEEGSTMVRIGSLLFGARY